MGPPSSLGLVFLVFCYLTITSQILRTTDCKYLGYVQIGCRRQRVAATRQIQDDLHGQEGATKRKRSGANPQAGRGSFTWSKLQVIRTALIAVKAAALLDERLFAFIQT